MSSSIQKTILIVDDQLENLQTIVDMFATESITYNVIKAPNGKIALKIIEEIIPDLIITDWEMPEMDGIEFIKQLKKSNITSDIPVIMCTGVMTSSENLNTALNAGAVDYIRKPIDKIELIARTKANLNLAESFQKIKSLNESLTELSQFKEDMTNMVVHDLKNPLSAIINIDLSSDNKEKMDIVKYSGYTMMNLVQNILEVYKYEQVAIQLNKEELNLIDIINKAIEEIEYLAVQKALEIKINVDNKIALNADVNYLRRMLANILSNAVKFSPENSEIAIKAKLINNNQLRLTIHNLGRHIPINHQQNIFKKFGQAEKKGQGRFSSTGLGLTFCKMAAEAHNGAIGVESEENKGVTFYLMLPDAKMQENNSEPNNAVFSKESAIHLSIEEKQQLKQVYSQLAALYFYEVSQFKKIFVTIKKENFGNEKWRTALEYSVYNCNEQKYKSLVAMINE